MTADTAAAVTGDAFAASRERFDSLTGWLDSADAAALSHSDLEERLDRDGRALLRQLVQDHLELRAQCERRVSVVDSHGLAHAAVETGHQRSLGTIFGDVTVTRLAYRRRGHPNLHPADAALNLPDARHSHGLRRMAATEASRGSFDQTVAAIGRATGQRVGKRQVEALTVRAAADFDDFYAQRRPPAADAGDALVLSVDGKGIVMRPEALRDATARAAAAATPKLAARLSKGEKRNRKRMATVAAVYDSTPARRRPDDILAGGDGPRAPAPVTSGKWLTASVADDAATVVGRMFDQAQRRDPAHARAWVVLVDGNNHQIDLVTAQARARGVAVRVVIDFVHVLEYLWKAAWSFYDEGDPAAEQWVRDKAMAVLSGGARTVAAAIRRKITVRAVDPTRATGAHRAADYLRNKHPYLGYPITLALGYPIATGVIEGACRHLVKDRLDIPAPAGDSTAPKPSCAYAPYTPTATSTTTGATTSTKNNTVSTDTATPTAPYQPPRRSLQRSHTRSMLRSRPTMPTHRHRRRTVSRYGQMAIDHSRRHRPDAYSQIPDPDAFFAEVGEEIAAEVTRLRDEILGPMRADENPESYRLRSYQALATIEEITLANHPLLQPEQSDETEDWSDDPDLARHYRNLAEINEAINTPL